MSSLGTLPAVSHNELHSSSHLEQKGRFKNGHSSQCLNDPKRLHRLADLIETHRDQLATIISLENGKPFEESCGEVAYSIGFFRWFGNSIVRLQGAIPASRLGLKVEVHHRPIGVCAAITPGIFP